jgi:archaeal type IV pilus assembly protein PilA
MRDKIFWKDDTAVENAIYSILMIAIVVMVALMIGSIVIGQEGNLPLLSSSPKASMTGILESGSPGTLRINHESGDPLEIKDLNLSVYDNSGIFLGTVSLKSASPAITPETLDSGMQTSPITLDGAGTILSGKRYTVKVISIQTKQQIGMLILVAQ